MIAKVYRIEDRQTGETLFCNNPTCGSNYFFRNASGVMVCNGCETLAMLRPDVEFVEKDWTQASGRVFHGIV